MKDLSEYSVDDEFYFQWHITNECNLRCKHCYHSDYIDDSLKIDQLLAIGNHLCDAAQKWGKKASFSLTGGEPFTNSDKIFSLLELLENRNIDRIDILTNGLLINDNIIEKLKRYNKLRRIQLSLEGLQETNDEIRGAGSFAKTVKIIKLLKDHSFTISVMMTIGKHNKNEVIPLAKELGTLNVDAFILDRFIPEGQSQDKKDWLLSSEDIKQVYSQAYAYFQTSLKPRFLLYRTLFCLLNPNDSHIGAICSVGNNAVTIMPNGDVLPCRRLPVKLGNLLEETIFNIWYTSPLLWEMRNPENLKGKCNNCEHIPICRGCRAMAYAITGDYFESDPQCWK